MDTFPDLKSGEQILATFACLGKYTESAWPRGPEDQMHRGYTRSASSPRVVENAKAPRLPDFVHLNLD